MDALRRRRWFRIRPLDLTSFYDRLDTQPAPLCVLRYQCHMIRWHLYVRTQPDADAQESGEAPIVALIPEEPGCQITLHVKELYKHAQDNCAGLGAMSFQISPEADDKSESPLDRSDMNSLSALVGTLTAELSSLFLMCYLVSPTMRYDKQEATEHLYRLERIVNAGSKIRGDKIAEKSSILVHWLTATPRGNSHPKQGVRDPLGHGPHCVRATF